MRSQDAPTQGTGEKCLQQLAEMREELEVAITCVAQNSLVDFEVSLWRQEVLCASLKRSLQELVSSSAAPQAATQLRSAAMSMEHINRQYGSVVQQASRSTAHLRDLCRLYKNAPFQKVSAPSKLSLEA